MEVNSLFSTIACVAGVRKGRGRELGRETSREGGEGKAREKRPGDEVERLYEEPITVITQSSLFYLQHNCAYMYSISV